MVGFRFLIVKCPMEMPEVDRGSCFFNNATGICGDCAWYIFHHNVEIGGLAYARAELDKARQSSVL
jgi:hypothetical protein